MAGIGFLCETDWTEFGRMALANKIGSLLKKATNSSPTLYQAIRCMSSSKLFVGGLSYGTDDHSLKDAFANYGQVIEARIIQDRETGRSRGFGFVTYTSSEEAAAAITALDGQDLHGRSIRVNYATERTGGFRSGGGGGYGGGGYGGGGGFGGGGYGGSYGNRGGDYGGSGGGGYGVVGGSRDNDTFSVTNFAGGGGNSFTGSNFGGDSGFSGNPAGNFGAAGGSTGGDDFSSGAPGDNFESGKNDDLMGDLIKDDVPDTYATKGASLRPSWALSDVSRNEP